MTYPAKHIRDPIERDCEDCAKTYQADIAQRDRQIEGMIRDYEQLEVLLDEIDAVLDKLDETYNNMRAIV